MTDEIRTPGGRVLSKFADVGDDVTEYRGNGASLIRRPDGRMSSVSLLRDSHRGTLDDCLSWLDARADETVAALLPPGSMVVTEDRVVELASILVKRVAGDHVSGLARVGAVNALIADLRAGAQS